MFAQVWEHLKHYCHLADPRVSGVLAMLCLQVHHLTDALVFSAFLQRLKETTFPSGKKAVAGTKDSASQQQDLEDGPAAAEGGGGGGASSSAGSDDNMLTLAREAMLNLGVALQQISLKGNDDVRQMCIEGCAEFLVATKAMKVPSTFKGTGIQPGACRLQQHAQPVPGQAASPPSQTLRHVTHEAIAIH
jgi:hypothetical protein